MKFKQPLGILGVALGMGIGFISINQPTAHAAYYYWTKTKNYATPVAYHQKNRGTTAYMWDAHHTKKLHNLKNYPRTTWYLSKSVKMRGSIYYQVKSGNRKTTGYVWRGYLTKGVSPYAGTKTTNVTSTNANPTSSEIPTIVTMDGTIQVKNEQLAQNNAMSALFTGTVYNQSLARAASQLANGDAEGTDEWMNLEKSVWAELTPSQVANKIVLQESGDDTLQNNLWSGKISFAEYVKEDLAKQGIDPTSYAGWQIGTGSIAKDDHGSFSGYGWYKIILVPAGD